MVAQMLWHMYIYVNPNRVAGSLPDLLQVANALHNLPGDSVAMLVSSSERTAQAILPASQTISSSFRYGGAPSVVWYSDKHVDFYYNYDNFTVDLNTAKHPLAITTLADQYKVPPNYHPIINTDDYIGYLKWATYVHR
jgi:hypothetical protein